MKKTFGGYYHFTYLHHIWQSKLKKNTWRYYHFTHVYHKWNHLMYGSWDVEHEGQNILSFWTSFCTFTPLTTHKIKILKKWEKAWRYYHFIQVFHKWQSYDAWFLRCGAWQTEFVVILDHFCTFTPLTTQKIKTLEKWENACIYYHFTHVYHKWQLYDVRFLGCGAWQTEFLSFWTIFCPFTPLKTWKINIWKKWKKCLEISFYTNVPKIMIICCLVPEIECVTYAILIFCFGLFFALLPSSQPKKSKF